MANVLPKDKEIAIIAALAEGSSLRAVTRITGIHRTTIMKLLCDLGRAFSEYQDNTFRNLKSKRIQCDEIWSFCGAKQRQVNNGAKAEGDVWTWTAMDADTKLMVFENVVVNGPVDQKMFSVGDAR